MCQMSEVKWFRPLSYEAVVWTAWVCKSADAEAIMYGATIHERRPSEEFTLHAKDATYLRGAAFEPFPNSVTGQQSELHSMARGAK